MNRRVVVAGISILAFLAAIFVAGYFLIGGRNGSPSNNNASPSPTPTDARADVERAYLRFWDVWADANLRLDPTRLSEVAAGKALEAFRSTVEQQKSKNQPVRVRVEHNHTIAILGATDASVDDRYIDHSVRLDPNTKEPVEPDPKQSLHQTYAFKKVDGKWKIAEVIEYRSP